MSTEQIALAALVLNAGVIPFSAFVARLLWRMDRRIYRLELKLGIIDKE